MSKYLAIPEHLKSLIEKRDWTDRRNKERRRKRAAAKLGGVATERRSGQDKRGKLRRKADVD